MSPLKVKLEPRSIASCPEPDVPVQIRNAFPHGMLQHQVEVYQKAKTHDIILDLAPTGTGKTSAGLSVIAHNRDRHAIYIAPTNALIEQQTEAAKKFVQDAGLPHVVKAASARQVRAWPKDRVGERPGEKLYNLLREPTTLFPDCENRPILLVTNPDIFYYAAFFQYGRLDRTNIASVFYSSFATIIFDEFHLYDAKQLVSLLFYLALSKAFHYFQNNRKVVLLTATPEHACEAALERLAVEGIQIAHVDGESKTAQMLPSQTAVSLDIRKRIEKEELITEIQQEVIQRIESKTNQFGAVILDSLDYVNLLNKKLRDSGYEEFCGRITGPEKSKEARHRAAQKLVILATSTVDVGFNFERDSSPERQNLDWLIFSCRDRFSFWQRIGRVGRVLGKTQTDITSEAIAYLSEKAWEEGIENLDFSGGRDALKQNLESLKCMKKHFLEVYWKSEAFLEIARPLLELEDLLKGLDQDDLIGQIFKLLQSVLGNSRSWKTYRWRMRQILVAEKLADAPLRPKKEKQWSFVKTLFKQPPCWRHDFIKLFLKLEYPEQFSLIESKEFSIKEIEHDFKEDQELATQLKDFAFFWKTVWSPLFRFRDSLFQTIKISDPQQLLLDHGGETDLDPIHLLRFYEFECDGGYVEILRRAKEPYSVSFKLKVNDLQIFHNTELCKLSAFKNCLVSRTCRNSIRQTTLPLALVKEIEETLMPGVIVQEVGKNGWAIARLKKQGLESYKIGVSDPFNSKEYLFFPSLSGILAIASAGVALKCPDEEDFWIA